MKHEKRSGNMCACILSGFVSTNTRVPRFLRFLNCTMVIDEKADAAARVSNTISESSMRSSTGDYMADAAESFRDVGVGYPAKDVSRQPQLMPRRSSLDVRTTDDWSNRVNVLYDRVRK